MADNPIKKKNFIPKTPQKPNYQVWIILSLALLVFSIFYFNRSAEVEDITERRFEEMARKGHVKEILVIKNQDLVEVFLNEEG
jgi:AFG3 family protein